MAFNPTYAVDTPERAKIDALPGLTLIEFGTGWCGHCQAARPAIESALADFPELPHLKFEDGPGRALGRSFRVKLWPTLILMLEGVELQRLVRPTDAAAVLALLKSPSKES